jgi:cytochrome c556
MGGDFMFKHRRVAEAAVVVALVAGLGGAVYAQDQISQRQALMKSIATDLNQVRTNASATPVNMAAAKASADKLAANMKRFPTLFPKTSDITAGKTRAKPEIWSDAAGWKAANDKATAAANAMAVATNGSDADAVLKAVTAFQQNCASCHTPYRGPAIP